MRPYRGRGVLRLSEDGGRTWIESRTFNPAHYVYQCMTILPDGMLGLLWEREMQVEGSGFFGPFVLRGLF